MSIASLLPIIVLGSYHPKLCNERKVEVKNVILSTYEKQLLLVMNANFNEKVVLSPRIPIVSSTITFKFKRLQFPIHLNIAQRTITVHRGIYVCFEDTYVIIITLSLGLGI